MSDKTSLIKRHTQKKEKDYIGIKMFSGVKCGADVNVIKEWSMNKL